MCVCVCVTELKGRELLEIVGSPAHMAAYPSFAQIQLNTMAMSLSSADSERSGSLLSLVKKPVTNRLTDITTRALMYGRADASERRRQTQGVRVQNYAEKVEVCIGQIGGASRAAVIKNLVAAAASKARSVAGSAAAAGMASATAPAALAGAIGSGVPAAGAVNAELAAANAAAELEMADDHADDDIDAELGHDLVTAGVAVMSAPEGDVHAELLLSDAGLDVLAGLLVVGDAPQGLSAGSAVRDSAAEAPAAAAAALDRIVLQLSAEPPARSSARAGKGVRIPRLGEQL